MAFNRSKLKAFYQHSRVVIPEFLAKKLSSYSFESSLRLARDSLDDRCTESPESVRFLMVVPIVNWETALLTSASNYGHCFHLSFDSRGYFPRTDDWKQYKRSNASLLLDFFEKNYSPSDLNIVFLYISDFHIDPVVLESIKRKNTLLVLFSWDDRLHYSSCFHGQHSGIRRLASASDICLTTSINALSRYAFDNVPIFYWHGIPRTNTYSLDFPPPSINRVLFYGSAYGYRLELINYLIARSIPIDVYGKGWNTEFISYEALSELVPKYSVVLGISTVAYTRSIFCVKGRDLEVPSLGGLYLTNDSVEIDQVFRKGHDILTYCSKYDCYQQVLKVLSDPHKYSSIRYNGQIAAQKYSWSARFAYLQFLVRLIIGVYI